MYQVSETLDAVISGSGRTFYARLNGVQKGIQRITQTSMSTPDDYMYVGSAIASKIEVSMYTRSQDFKDGVELKFEIGASTGNTVEWIPMGYFTIQDSKKDRDLLAFTAYDRIGSLLKEEYKCKLSYPSESKEFLKDISEQTGIQFDLSSLSGDFMIDKILSIDDDENENNKVYKEPFAGFTMQQVVGYIAQLHGKFAVCDRDGKVVFRWYSKIKMESENNRVLDNQLIPIKDQLGNMLYDSEIDFSDDGRLKSNIEDFILDQDSFFIYDTLQYYAAAQTYIVKSNRYFDDLVKGLSKCEITGIGCQTETEYITSGESTELVIENQVMKQEWLDGILAVVKQMNFYPASFSFMGDPRIDVGDIIVIIDAYGNPIDVPIMRHVLNFDGGLLSEVSSYGTEATEMQSPSSAALDRVRNDILILKELTAQKITADTADIKYARLDKVNIEEGWITTAMIGDAQITDAKIQNMSADKLTVGTLDAKKVTLINLDASSITTGTITGLDAIFNRSFTVNSPYSDTQSFVIEANQNNIIIGTRIKDVLYSTDDNSIIFSPTGVTLQGGSGVVEITAKHDVTIGTDGGSIYLNANGTTYNDIPIYARNDVYTFKILHEGNATLKSEFSSGVEIGSISLGTLSMTLKVPLASTTQSGLITASEKSKLNTDYLPLTGGTLGSSNVNVLGLNCTSGMMSTLRFYGSGKRLGSVGFNAQNSSLYRWNASGTAYRILDENDLPLMTDSGWVNITVTSGLSVIDWVGARVRKIGNMVNVVMGVTGVTTGYKTIGTLSTAYRPPKEVNIAARYGNSPDAQIAITAEGNIMVMARTSGNTNYDPSTAICFSTTYFV